MKNYDNDFESRLDGFQQRLEELAIEKELFLSKLFTTKEKLEKIKSRLNESRVYAENRLDASIITIE